MHEIRYLTCMDTEEDKAKLEEMAIHTAQQNGDGGGLQNEIQWKSAQIKDGYEEALEYLKSIDSEYANIAVRYFVFSEKALSQKAQNLKNKTKELMDAYVALNNIVQHKKDKKKYITCKDCGSKLNTVLYDSNICPACKNDLRSASAMKRIAKAKEAYEKMLNKYKEQMKKDHEKILNKKNNKNDVEVKWLLKIEYHC